MAPEFTYCARCGKQLPPLAEIKFCPHCGAAVTATGKPAMVGGLERLVVEEKILPPLLNGNKIEAIKVYRGLTQAGLKEALQQVEKIALEYHVSAASGGAVSRPSGKFGCGGYFLFFSLFFGFMIGTAGLAVFPTLGQVASPFVCDGGLFQNSNHYNPSPGTSVTTRHFYCADRREVSLQVALVSGCLYASVLFLLALLYSGIRALTKRNPANALFERKDTP